MFNLISVIESGEISETSVNAVSSSVYASHFHCSSWTEFYFLKIHPGQFVCSAGSNPLNLILWTVNCFCNRAVLCPKVSATARMNRKSLSLNDSTIIFSNTRLNVPSSDQICVEIQRYTKLDSIKFFFFSRWFENRKGANIRILKVPDSHYFVHPNGKKNQSWKCRLSGAWSWSRSREKIDEFGAPPFAFLLHDLESEIDCEIYLKDPHKFLLESVSFTDAVKSLGK